MKKLLLASAAALALTSVAGTAGAADLPPQPAYKAPIMVAQPYNWTGFYVGGYAGANIGESAWGAGYGITPYHQGAIGGGQVGAQLQMGMFVLGVEGDLGGTNAAGSVQCPNAALFTCQGRMDWLATARGRLGVTWDRALFYVTGGGAWAQTRLQTEFNGVGGIPPSGGRFNGSDATVAGWTFGGGFEFGLYENWSTKIEYLYYELDSAAYTLDNGITTTGQFSGNVLRVGLNYRFGNWAAPVQARY